MLFVPIVNKKPQICLIESKRRAEAIFLPPKDEDERVITDSLKVRLGQLDEKQREQLIAVMLCHCIRGNSRLALLCNFMTNGLTP